MSGTSNTNELELGEMKVNDLNDELKSRDLGTVVIKQEYIERTSQRSEFSDIEDNVLDEYSSLDQYNAVQDDFGYSDIDDSKFLEDIFFKEEKNNVGNVLDDDYIHDSSLDQYNAVQVNDLNDELNSEELGTVVIKQEYIESPPHHSESSDFEDDYVLDEYIDDSILAEYNTVEDDFGYSDSDDLKFLGDIFSEEEKNNIGNGIIHEKTEVQQVTQPKKVNLKRSSDTMLNGDDIKPKKQKKINEEIDESINKDRIIELDEVEAMSHTERIILNAKNLGNEVSEDKKLARLITFDNVTVQNPVADVHIDKLKMRAERFGEIVSKTLNDRERENQLKVRELRFGPVGKTVLTAIKKRNISEVGKQKNTIQYGNRRSPNKKRYL